MYNCTTIINNFFQKIKCLIKYDLKINLYLSSFHIRHAARQFLHFAADLRARRWPVIFCIFLPWYLWSLAYYPETSLWWVAFPLSIILITVSLLWHRSILYWLPPAVLFFNTLYFWLPWPGVKPAYIAPATVCFVMGFIPEQHNIIHQRRPFSFGFCLFFTCLAASAFIGILSHFAWNHPAAWRELLQRIRLVPLLDETDPYVPLRYLWMWSLALGTYLALLKLLRRLRDIHILLWMLHWSVIPVSIVGIYSYASGTLMVSTYQYEHRINATFSSPAVLADIMTFVLISGLYLFSAYKSRLVRISLGILILLELTLIILSGCRINLVIIILLAGAWSLWAVWRIFRQRKLRAFLATGAFLIICTSCWFFMPSSVKEPVYTRIAHVPVVQRMKQWHYAIRRGGAPLELFSARWHHWQCALNMVKDFPAWGIGCGMFEQYYIDYRLKQDLFHYARAHNVFLRICAEGGLITMSVFLIFLTGTIRSLHRACRSTISNSRRGWLRCVRWLTLALGILAITALSSDILYENVESVMFLAIAAACLSRGCAVLSSSRIYAEPGLQYPPRRVDTVMQLVLWRFSGVIFGQRWMSSLLKIVLILLAFISITYGITRATGAATRKSFSGSLQFGLSLYNPPGQPKGKWRAVHRHAYTGFTVNRPVMYFSYRALDDRMARLTNILAVSINNEETVQLRIDSKESRTLYFDMTALSGMYCTIEWQASRAFSPWKEHWFGHPHSFSALISLPRWSETAPVQMMTNTPATWCISWSADPEMYRALGFTSAVHTISY